MERIGTEKTLAERNWKQIQQLVCDAAPAMKMKHAGKNLFLFGAGATGALSIPLIKEEGISLAAICDNGPEKQGTVVEGLPCISPSKLLEYPDAFVLVTTNRCYTSVHQQLEDMNIQHCPLETWLLERHMELFREVYDTLDDDISRMVYTNILLYRMTGDRIYTESCCCGEQYFCFPGFSSIAGVNERFVDCGAYVGDILEKFVENSSGIFDKLYAFEPVKRTFSAMEKRVAHLKEIWALSDSQIICEPYGVGREHMRMEYHYNAYLASTSLTANSTSANSSSMNNFVEVIGLDEYFAQREENGITFIKADIEGSEWDMLHGAEQTIRRCRPRLAICIYHSAFDLFRLQKYLRQLVPEYRFHIRHHSADHAETVLYCHI